VIPYVIHSTHYLEDLTLECHAVTSGLVQQVRGLLAYDCPRVANADGVRGAPRTSGEALGGDGKVRGLTPPVEREPRRVHGNIGMLVFNHFL